MHCSDSSEPEDESRAPSRRRPRQSSESGSDPVIDPQLFPPTQAGRNSAYTSRGGGPGRALGRMQRAALAAAAAGTSPPVQFDIQPGVPFCTDPSVLKDDSDPLEIMKKTRMQRSKMQNKARVKMSVSTDLQRYTASNSRCFWNGGAASCFEIIP